MFHILRVRSLTRFLSVVMCLGICAFAAPVGSVGKPFIVVQSTTSTQNSGLFDYLLPKFEAATGIEVRVVAVGTGQAIKNASNGDGDVIIVHATSAEEAFVESGHGLARHDLMYNDFIVVGPPDDPARIAESEDAASAFASIARTEAKFASRGDDSGTHLAERRLWALADVHPDNFSGDWYYETGSGMGATLNIAKEVDAYVLTDRASWISFMNKGDHRILMEGDSALFNQYGIVRVNPERHPETNAEAASTFIDWMLSDEGQAEISQFTVDGQQLFFANASR